MELSYAGLAGAVIGAVIGAVNYAIIIGMVEGKLRAFEAKDGQDRDEMERRIAAGRRAILAFDMLIFIGAGYWVGTRIGG